MTKLQYTATQIANAKLLVARIQRDLPEINEQKKAGECHAHLISACDSLQKAVEALRS